MKPGHWLRLFVVLLALSGAAGCSGSEGTLVRAAVETHVRADGNAERRVVVDASSPGPTLQLVRGWSLDTGVDAAGRSVAVGRSYDLSGGSSGGLSLAVEDHFFWQSFEFSDRPEGLLEGNRRLSGDVTYKLVMPGRISASYGAAQTSGGAAIYDFGSEEDLAVRAESWMVRWWAVVGTSGGLLVVAALILGGRAASAVRSIPRWLWSGRWSREPRVR